MSSPIPAFYRIFFTWIDPALCLFGVYAHTLSPDFILTQYVASPALPATTETTFLLQYSAGFFALLAFLQIFLLRARPNDILVWKAVQFSTVFVDVAVVSGFYLALEAQGRLDVAKVRPEEWNNILGNAAVGVIRLLFCAGVGLSGANKVKSR